MDPSPFTEHVGTASPINQEARPTDGSKTSANVLDAPATNYSSSAVLSGAPSPVGEGSPSGRRVNSSRERPSMTDS